MLVLLGHFMVDRSDLFLAEGENTPGKINYLDVPLEVSKWLVNGL